MSRKNNKKEQHTIPQDTADILNEGLYEGTIVKGSLRGKNRQKKVKFLPGDKVLFRIGNGVDDDTRGGAIEELLPRKNELVRPPVANIDQLVILTALADPAPDLRLIDRLTVFALWNEVTPVLCFNKADLERNRLNAKSAKWSAVASAANAVGGTAYNAYEQGKMANAALDRIVDYSRCPNCNSTDITELTEEEFKKLSAENTQPSAPVISSADELKKFKELLDSGIITQEEFDAKKKQLLGL